MFESGAVKAFGDAAVCQELPFELSNLAAEQVSGLVQQADQSVGCHFRGGGGDAEWIMQVGLAGKIVPPHGQGFRRVFVPESQAALADEVSVILEEFFQTAAGDAGESEFAPGGNGGLGWGFSAAPRPAATASMARDQLV